MKKYPAPLVAFLAIISGVAALEARESWIPLFDGKSLDGWRINENPDSWAVEDGAIVTRGKRSHLFYAGEVAGSDFRNFEFKAEVMTEPGSNSGIYIHTRFQEEGWPTAGYELQVLNSAPSGPANYVERKMTGSVYAVRNTWKAPVADGVWFDYRIRVSGKTIQTYIDGELLCQYTEPEDPWRPDDKKKRLLGSGTFALQAHDPDSVVRFRGIAVRLLPDDAPSLGEPLADRELDRLITRFSDSNHPLVDIGIATPNAPFARRQSHESRRYGMTFFEVSPSEFPAALLVVNDRVGAPSVEALEAAKSKGVKVAFSSGGALGVDESRLKTRLQAMSEADLHWSDLWVPGK